MSARIKFVVFVLCLISLFPAISFKGKYYFRADELFGEGTAYSWQIDTHVFAIFRPDGAWHNHIWLLWGEEAGSCKLKQITGDRVTGVVNGYVPCQINLHKWYNKGSIDFRGDPLRPFVTKLIREGE